MPDVTRLFVGMPPSSVRPDQKKELHALCNKLEAARVDAGYKTAEAFATAAGHSVSTWHAWRRPNPTSPKFFDLRDFFRVLGWDVKPILHDGAVRVDTDKLNHRGGDRLQSLQPETEEVIRLMDGLPKASRSRIRDAAFAANVELHANPTEPGEANGAGRARP